VSVFDAPISPLLPNWSDKARWTAYDAKFFTVKMPDDQASDRQTDLYQ
jgi:hypothetical protein